MLRGHSGKHPLTSGSGSVVLRAAPAQGKDLAATVSLLRATGCVNRLAWSSDGTLLVSGSDDRALGLWRYSEPAHRVMVDTEHVCVSARRAVPITLACHVV